MMAPCTPFAHVARRALKKALSLKAPGRLARREAAPKGRKEERRDVPPAPRIALEADQGIRGGCDLLQAEPERRHAFGGHLARREARDLPRRPRASSRRAGGSSREACRAAVSTAFPAMTAARLAKVPSPSPNPAGVARHDRHLAKIDTETLGGDLRERRLVGLSLARNSREHAYRAVDRADLIRAPSYGPSPVASTYIASPRPM